MSFFLLTEEHFIKRPLPRPLDAREAADNQAANPYNKPYYEREPGYVDISLNSLVADIALARVCFITSGYFVSK